MKRILLLLCLVCLFTLPAMGQTVNKLAWDASPTANVTYNVYRKDASCTSTTGAFVKLNTAPVAVLTFDDTAVPSGKVCYMVRAVDADGVESVDSNRVSLPRPSPPGNLRTAP